MTPEQLKHIRASTGWSQETFAHKTGVSKATLIRYEAGRVKPSMAYEFMVKTKYGGDDD